jgi:hypothetical protein
MHQDPVRLRVALPAADPPDNLQGFAQLRFTFDWLDTLSARVLATSVSLPVDPPGQER